MKHDCEKTSWIDRMCIVYLLDSIRWHIFQIITKVNPKFVNVYVACIMFVCNRVKVIALCNIYKLFF